MAQRKKIDLKFAIFFGIAIVLGFLIPDQLKGLGFLVQYFLMVVLFAIFLKIDIFDVLKHLKKPLTIGVVLLVHLIVFPIVIYLLSFPFDDNLKIGLLLLASLPAGVSAAALTDIVKGKTSLALLITVLSTLLAIITMPLLWRVLLKTTIELDYVGITISLMKLILIPLILSQIVKKLLKKRQYQFVRKHTKDITIVFISFILAIVIGGQASEIVANWSKLLYYLVVLYVVFFIFQIGAFYLTPKMRRDERIALSCSKTFMNTALGITLAYLFFSPQIALVIIIAEIPWSTMLIVFSLYERFLP